MLVSPEIRMERESSWAMANSVLRKKRGESAGINPSMTSTKDSATQNSDHIFSPENKAGRLHTARHSHTRPVTCPRRL